VKVQPLDIYQGDDYAAVANVTHEGLPVDLSPYTASAQIRRSPADLDASVDATFTCNCVGSTVQITLAHTVTVALSGCYVWDLELTETATGLIRTIARGPVHVSQEVTRP
jgi:hypothetical protein